MNAETTEASITAWLATQQQAMLDALEAMVNTDGGSYDKAGVDAVGVHHGLQRVEHRLLLGGEPGGDAG